MRNGLFMIILLFRQPTQAQDRKGFEEYYSSESGRSVSSVSTRLYYQPAQGWYTEFRYNYEEENTAAFSVGKTFSKDEKLSWSVTPELGLAAGKLQGVSLGVNTTLSAGRISFSSVALCTKGFEADGVTRSFFAWSELNGRICKQLYAGVTLELCATRHRGVSEETAAQLGFTFGRWTIPLYLFKPADAPLYFVTAICYELKK
jgi:hypothetical protein